MSSSSSGVRSKNSGNTRPTCFKRGKYTWVFLDEVYLYFKYKYSGEILYRAWKRFRKYGAALTAATQNVEECLKSETARLMFANSEFLLLFKLLSNNNKIFTRRQLMDEIWDLDSESDERTVNVHINRLRDRFRDNPDFDIVTVRGLGYKAVKTC